MIVLTITASADGRLYVEPSTALTDELRQIIRANKESLAATVGKQTLVFDGKQIRRHTCKDCLHLAKPGRSDGYCAARPDLPPAYGEGHPLRRLPDDLGASCTCFERFDQPKPTNHQRKETPC